MRDVLEDQCEANETLVLAGIRAHEEADAALDEADALKSTAEFRERLIGIIGHDLKNPLSAIVLAGGRLSRGGHLSEQDTYLANLIVKSGHRMSRMISELIEFTRARLGGGFALKLASSDLGEICWTTAEELRVSSALEIQCTGEGDLVGTWDADRLAQVISNLAGNAVDHATPGTPVLIHAYGEGETVVADITNEGVVISQATLPEIFKAFRRADADTERAPGHLGLGLYIAHEITRAHGGTLAVRSSEGVTTFSMRLPRVVLDASKAFRTS